MADMFIWTPSQHLHETFNHGAIKTVRRHIFDNISR